jgi:OOP family OmpA-OmpF porin
VEVVLQSCITVEKLWSLCLADLSAPPSDLEPGPFRPRLSAGVVAPLVFVAAAALALLSGEGLASFVESRSAEVIRTRMLTDGYPWAHVATDGLIVTMTGTAPTEAQRFAAINLASTVVDSGRVRDEFEVQPATVVAPPRFSVEMLRNDDGLQLIGLLPEGEDRGHLTEAAEALKSNVATMDMLETATYPAPAGWENALNFGITALKLLPRSKISVAADGVSIVAIAASGIEKRQFEAALASVQPKGLRVTTNISAPRPVLTPFTLRFVIDAKGARFNACSADTDLARTRILAAARTAGASGDLTCTVGMGVPSPSWSQATSLAIHALAEMGGGTVTFSDADITLQAGDTVTQARFDTAVGELRAALPDVFSLDAKMPQKTLAVAGPVEFTARLDPKTHRAELRGKIGDDRMQAAVTSFAKAQFGADKVYVATLPDPTLPDGWAERVLAGLQALANLDSGALLVRNDTVEVSGISGSQNASDTISQLLSERLGQGKTFKIDVSYDKALDPMAGLPTPQECLDRMQAVLARQKISFGPGSAELDAASGAVMDDLAVALKNCDGIKLEIGGHTDAQGSVQGNLALSQARAETVLVALQGRQVDVSSMHAVGYGESRAIADNSTDAGREANRRIEFSLSDAPAAEPAVTAPGKGAAAFAIKPTETWIDAAHGPTPHPAPNPQTQADATGADATAEPAVDPAGAAMPGSDGDSANSAVDSGGDSAAGPAVDPAVDPTTGAAVDPATDPAVDPAAGASADANAGPAADPAATTAAESPAAPAAASSVDPTAETAADGSALAPDQPTMRPRGRPAK